MTLPVTIKVLEDGRTRVHWFRHDDAGAIATTTTIKVTRHGPLKFGGSRGCIVCMPKLASLTSPRVNGRYVPWHCSGEVNAVTCPECMATHLFKEAFESQPLPPQMSEEDLKAKNAELQSTVARLIEQLSKHQGV